MYYVRNSELLFHCLDEIIEKDIRTQDEYQLTDGLQLMLEYGEQMCGCMEVSISSTLVVQRRLISKKNF